MTSDPSSEPAASALQPGQIIAERYLVGDVLGGGGMGVVRAGTHVLLGTPVAIKVIHPELKDDTEVVHRFINEARAAAALKGEHIARVFDVGALESGEPYLVMEQLEGVTLDQYLAGRGPLSRAETVNIVLQVCDGLAEAHAAGLVHRDIKPANLFLARRSDEQFSLKILDFGIAKRVDTVSPAVTDPGKSLGSPWYMSPEQMLTPSNVDAHADVWSLGVLLFELLTARLPFEGESVPQVCANVLAAAAPPPSLYRADVGPELDAIVLRCLEKEPARRFDSVAALARALLPLSSTGSLGEGTALQVPASQDSLTPLQSSVPDRRSRVTLWRAAWPMAVGLVVVAALLPRGSHQYLDASVPADVPEATPLLASERPSLLQYLNGARAVPELERPAPAPATRSPRHDAWLRAQELKSLHESENRYGL